VGPSPAALELFGDKARARALAQQCGIPVLEGTSGATSLEAARALLASFGAGASLMIKAVAGGGGRGVRPVHSADELEKAFERCASEARAAFGSGDLYVERWLPHARHVEVQIAGDVGGSVVQFGEARVQPPAPPPEAGRDRARAVARASAARAPARRCRRARARRALQRARHGRVPRRRRCARLVLLHRGERAAAGGAHRHRGA
jgi:biotin carboxylase